LKIKKKKFLYYLEKNGFLQGNKTIFAASEGNFVPIFKEVTTDFI